MINWGRLGMMLAVGIYCLACWAVVIWLGWITWGYMFR